MAAGLFCAHSSNPDTVRAVTEIVSLLPPHEPEFLLVLHGPNHTGELLEQALDDSEYSNFFGCSTSGEITPAGYHLDSMVGISFERPFFNHVARRIDGLGDFEFQHARELILSMQWELREKAPASNTTNTFALLLIDSLSQSEEFVAAALGSELGTIPLIGASSGDNWQLESCPILYKGRSYSDSAVLLMVHSELEFRHYNFNHFAPSEQRGVITSATPEKRLIHEINGAPAAEEYARLCGDEVILDQAFLATRPAIITVGDRAYPRGFLELLDDGSMRLACAVDEGVVFRVASQADYLQHLEERFARIRQEIGGNLVTLGFECAARRQIVEQQDLGSEIAELFTEVNVWGFSCMGEQANALNMNNSFNGLAFRLQS